MLLQTEPVQAFVALGANLGDAAQTLRHTLQALAALPGSTLGLCSPLYRSAPVDSSGPDYVNAVVELFTCLSAPDLLMQLQKCEHAAGRERPYRNAPRTLDLDLLLYGSGRIDSAQLTVPHPRMHQRAFVLLPLADIAPERVSPVLLAAVQGQCLERID